MDLRARARAWQAQDPDPHTRAEIDRLLADEDATELERRFETRLRFGTAGLRGALGAGPNRMNRVVVAQAAAGLAAYLIDRQGDGPAPRVVVGYDARHSSDVFARDTAEIMSGAGVIAHLLPRALPTPVLAFAIRHLGADAGVMVTASHNPPRDNGYKVYLADSSQIVSPVDAEIAARIETVGRVDELPRGGDFHRPGPEIAEAYLDAVAGLVGDGSRDLRVVYTPLHGVGRDVFLPALRRAGFPAAHVVPEQADPDPDFPTVAFPNPEEPGAMDLALAAAADIDADLVVAHDPDADRCAVAVRRPKGDHRMLTGDELGVLLGDALLRRGADGTVAASIVSSELLGRIAAAAGRHWEQTLTGFKWIGKVDDLVFGYEEALGYCVAPHIARDKDGISAALLAMELAAEQQASGRTLLDRLDDLHREHGVHATSQLSVRVDDVTLIAAAMQRLRTRPPDELAGVPVTSVDDLADGYRGLPPTDGIRLGLGESSRIICRPSGTEPKLKCYVEVVVPVTDSLEAARAKTDDLGERLRADLATVLDLPT